MTSLILMLLFCLSLAIFAAQNTGTIQLHFLIWKTHDFSLAVLVILSAAVGGILTFLFSLPTHAQRYRQLKQRERELSELRDALGKH